MITPSPGRTNIILRALVSEKPGHNFTLNATFEEIKREAHDALVIPGGRQVDGYSRG
jgi:hypothetical protein